MVKRPSFAAISNEKETVAQRPHLRIPFQAIRSAERSEVGRKEERKNGVNLRRSNFRCTLKITWRRTVFWASIERWAAGLKSSEILQGEDFGQENGKGDVLRHVGSDLDHVGVSY